MKLRAVLFLVLGLSVSTPSFSLPVSAGLSVGKPLAFVDLNTEERKPLGAKFGFGIDVNIYIPDYPFAAGVFYDAAVLSDYGTLPVNNSGAQLSYYPFGKPLNVMNESGEVLTKNLGLTIYGTLGTGLTFLNVRDPAGAAIFGAAAFNLRVSSTMEYPVSEQFAVGASLLYTTTFGGSSADTPPVTVGVTGWSIMARTVITLN